MKPISFSKEALKTLSKLQKSNPQDAKVIARRIMEIRSNGITAHCKALQNSSPPKYRSRCGDYRIIYHISGGRIEVLVIGHRREVYRKTKNKNLI